MRAVVLCALLACLVASASSAAAPKPKATPKDSSVGYAPAAYSPQWVIVSGPKSQQASKVVKKVAAPGPAPSPKPEPDNIPPFLPTNSFSNTSATTTSTPTVQQHANSSVFTQLESAKSGALAEAWAYGKGSVQHGISVCGQAVANAFTNTCGKGNSVVAISTAAEVCANSVVKIYVDSLVKINSNNPTMIARANATGFATSTVRQVTEAIADGVALATAPCATAAAYVRSRAFADALTSVTARAVSTGDATGESMVWTQATGMAQAMAYGYAKALSQVMAKACACSNCGCQFPPQYYTDAAFSNTAGTTSQGKYAILTAVGNAGAMFCKGGSMQASVNTVLDTSVKVYANVLTQLNSLAHIDTKNASAACSQVFATGAATAIGEAMGDSLAGALAVNFHKSCGWALTGLSGKALTRSMAEVVSEASSATCAKPREYQNCVVGSDGKSTCFNLIGSTEQTINTVNNAVRNSPVASALAKAFSILKNKCKCEGNCWCSNGAKCSPMKTCPAFVEVAPKYQPPCTGYGCPPAPTPVPAPAPVPSPCVPGDYQKPCPTPPPSPSPTWSAYGGSQAPL